MNCQRYIDDQNQHLDETEYQYKANVHIGSGDDYILNTEWCSP